MSNATPKYIGFWGTTNGTRGQVIGSNKAALAKAMRAILQGNLSPNSSGKYRIEQYDGRRVVATGMVQS